MWPLAIILPSGCEPPSTVLGPQDGRAVDACNVTSGCDRVEDLNPVGELLGVRRAVLDP